MVNEFSGTAHGPVVQAGRIDHLSVHYRPPATHLRQLPPAVELVGRDTELAELRSLADTATTAIGVGGPRWAGRSALAVAFAHEIADRYPDGQLYLDLRGNRHNPLSQEEALRWALRSSGLAAEDVPDDPSHLVSAYRSALADRQVLVVLDNVVDETTVDVFTRPAGLVLATGRGAPLFPRGVAKLHVRPLALPDAIALLRREADSDICWYGDSAERLARLCGGLPLPLIAVADYLRRTAYSPRGLADLLADGRVPLSSLSANGVSLGDSLAVSYRRLPEEARPALRRLGVFPGATVNDRAVQAVIGDRAPDAVKRALIAEGLLVEHWRGGTTELPAPFRSLGREWLTDADGPADQVLDRILDHYVDAAESARTAWLGEHPPGTDGRLSEMVRRTSRGFFLGEAENLRSLVESAATRRLDAAVGLALPLLEYLTRQDEDLQAVHEPLLRAITDLSGDHRNAFALLVRLNETYSRMSRPAEAADCLIEAQRLARAAHDDELETRATRLLLTAFETKLALARESGDRESIANSLVLVASAHHDLDNPRFARQLLLEALDFYRTTDDVPEIADVLAELGDVSREAGHLAESAQFLRESVRLFEQIEDTEGLALALGSLSDTLTDLGLHDEAAALARSDELIDLDE
ncbi:tetratricopeptide repeat protein [Saccharothrix syringae]|uniref:Tetratricopeptide repeat protein n=1 Tax=Saccharothrix syringae TaxID=103733 RepID=A0A5Q0H2S2_SACSY|nr:tetratricopeptide repeat protein [Saccharothrix syringae]QFZ20498.1 tetratricopeptide repeat protein [Saccharothrix syringae]